MIYCYLPFANYSIGWKTEESVRVIAVPSKRKEYYRD